jgi:hypothetical protein
MSFIYSIILVLFTSLIGQEVFEGYTIFTPQVGNPNSGSETLLLNNDQETVHSWSHNRGPASMPYLLQGDEPGLENAILVYPYRVPNPTMDSGGVGGGVQFVDWNSNVLWDFVLSNEQYQHHHDVAPMPNGNILMVAWEAFTSNEAYDMGREPGSIDNPLNQMWSTAILEIEPYTNNVVWEWHMWDHLVQELGPGYGATYGNIEDHPELMNINEGNVGSGSGPGSSNADWIHINAIDYNESLDQIAISSRFMSEIYIIDHSTTTEEAASHEGGNCGKGGDFLYRWGNPQIYNRGNNSTQILDDQHSVNWIPEGYPGEGNLIVFNNRHQGNQSAGVEFTPPLTEDGNYIILGTQPFGPEEPTWVYHPGPGWHTNVQGGAFRLPNGNTLLTVCDDADIYEVTYEGEVVWDYHLQGMNVMIPRAQKYAIDAFEQEAILGDINGDEVLNVLDVILVVNMALGNAEIDLNGDMNNDGGINVLDVVLLVNLILR